MMNSVNDKVHNQVEQYMSRNTFDYHNFNLDELIHSMDPILWDSVWLMTRSISERRGTSKVSDTNSSTYHTKKLRCLFITCMIMYCADDRCSLPLHTLIADVVDSQGGTALLMQILNKLGVCVSLDVLSRSIQYSATQPLCKQLRKQMKNHFLSYQLTTLTIYTHSLECSKAIRMPAGMEHLRNKR